MQLQSGKNLTSPCIPEIDEKMPPKVLFNHVGLAVTLTFDLLTSKSNQFIFVPNCTEDLKI